MKLSRDAGNSDPSVTGDFGRSPVASIRMTNDAHTWIAGQHPTQSFRCTVGAIGNDDHTGTQDSARSLGVAADVFYTLSALGAAGTGWLFYDLYYGNSAPDAETSVGVMPTAGGAMIQLSIPLGGE